jgi:hypothetical protein
MADFKLERGPKTLLQGPLGFLDLVKWGKLTFSPFFLPSAGLSKRV